MSPVNEPVMNAGPNPFTRALERVLAVKGARWIIVAAVAALLTGVLGYLYLKTHGADVKRQYHARRKRGQRDDECDQDQLATAVAVEPGGAELACAQDSGH